MSQHAGGTGAWWAELPGSGTAAWSTTSPAPSFTGPAQDGLRGAVARATFKHGLLVAPGKRERAKREEIAQRRSQIIAAIREPSLKSGVITVGSGFGGTGKTDVAVTLAAIYAAARPADRVILADSNDDMPHGYIRLGGTPVEELPPHQRPLSLRGFYQACRDSRIGIYADLRDAVAWLQGVAVIRGDTADECVGVEFGEHEYLTVLEFLQCMSNIVINDGGTGLFARLQVGTLLHGDKYVFVTEASKLGYWSIDEVFSRYRNYEGEKEKPLTGPERQHLTALMDEATIVVDKFVASDPEQAGWYARICERFDGTAVSVVATPWDQALANRVPLDLGAVAPATLDAKLMLAEVVLRGADRANRRRHGLPVPEPVAEPVASPGGTPGGNGSGEWRLAERPSSPYEPTSEPASPGPDGRAAGATAPGGPPAGPPGRDAGLEDSDVRLLTEWPVPGRPAGPPRGTPDAD